MSLMNLIALSSVIFWVVITVLTILNIIQLKILVKLNRLNMELLKTFDENFKHITKQIFGE